jgi:hypothetical protein
MDQATAKRDRYQLETLLGAGGQGRTYRALDRDTGRFVAVKVIELRAASGWKPYDLFAREVQALQSLSHQGIPAFLDTYEIPEEGKYFLVMELIEGKTLDQEMRARRSFSTEEATALLLKVLSVLEYLHNRNPPVIHRDIKPANLVERPDGSIALLDFGGVRTALRPEGGSTMVGTFGYMAPEQLHGAAVPATDLYGLGATMAALLTGTEPERLPRKGLKLDLAAVMPASPLRDVLAKMLEPDPEQRYSSVQQIRAALTSRMPTSTAPMVPAGSGGSCRQCGKENPANFRFCMGCGADLTRPGARILPVATTPCPRCGNALPAGNSFAVCLRCGYDSRAGVPSSALVPYREAPPLANVPRNLPWPVQMLVMMLQLFGKMGSLFFQVVLPVLFSFAGRQRDRQEEYRRARRAARRTGERLPRENEWRGIAEDFQRALEENRQRRNGSGQALPPGQTPPQLNPQNPAAPPQVPERREEPVRVGRDGRDRF